MPRPKKILDKELVMELAGLNCSLEEIARIMKVSERTLQRNYADEITKGKEYVKTSLKRAQYRSALNGSFVMQIWLGKNLLGQADKVETHSRDEIIFTRSVKEFENDKIENRTSAKHSNRKGRKTQRKIIRKAEDKSTRK